MDLEKAKEFDKLFSKELGNKYTPFGNCNSFERVERFPIQCISLNRILGGGIPIGRIIEVFGQASAGKSALCTHIVSSFQQQDKLCLWIDVEHAMDPEFMQYCNVDLSKLAKLAPESAEEALSAVRMALKAKDEDGNPIVDLIVLDSVAALVPSEEYQKDVGGGMIANLARLMSQSLKQIATLASLNKITVLLINQERASNLVGYGKKSDTAGGNALKYYTSIRIDLNRTAWLEDNKKKIGQTVHIEVVKNKTATPFQFADIDIVFPHQRNGIIFAGVDVFSDVINIAIENDIIKRTGAWFEIPDLGKKLNGLNKVQDFYNSNPDKYTTLYNKVLTL